MTIPYFNKYSKLSSVMEKSLLLHLKSRGFVDPRIVMHWVSIVGDLGKCASPVSMKNIKGKQVLYLKAGDLAFYSQFRYYRDKMLLSLSSYFGSKVVDDIQLIR